MNITEHQCLSSFLQTTDTLKRQFLNVQVSVVTTPSSRSGEVLGSGEKDITCCLDMPGSVSTNTNTSD